MLLPNFTEHQGHYALLCYHARTRDQSGLELFKEPVASTSSTPPTDKCSHIGMAKSNLARETVPLLTSDMGKNTVSVLAHPFLPP